MGEAKLRERVRDDAFSSLVARIARFPAAAPVARWISVGQVLMIVSEF